LIKEHQAPGYIPVLPQKPIEKKRLLLFAFLN
jgi:hypothetical protein